MIAKSDCAAVPTVALAVLVLLYAIGSVDNDDTCALAVSVVPFGTVGPTLVTTANVADEPAVSPAATHEIAPVPPTAGVVQLQPAGATIDWNVKFPPAGIAVVKNGLVASAGPLFITTSVKVRTPLSATNVGDAELSTDRSVKAGAHCPPGLGPPICASVAFVITTPVLPVVAP